MVAALIGTLAGFPLEGGTPSIFPSARFVNLIFISMEMFATTRHLQASARLGLYGSHDFAVRMAIVAGAVLAAIFQLVLRNS